MTDRRERADANNCFVCGPANPFGLQVKFRLDGDVCRAEFSPAEHHCGWDEVTHGGIIFSLLDDVMANWFFLRGERAVTGKCEIRFRRQAQIGEPLLLEAECVKRKGRVAKMASRAVKADGELVAEATASFAVAVD